MRIMLLTLFLIALNFATFACEVCERNKPKFLQGITHGSNPESNWDYVIVGVISIIAIFTLFYSIKFIVHPNEDNPDHIKYTLKEQ